MTTKTEVIILSRNRPEMAQKSVEVWAERGHPVTLMTEPEQRIAYAAALAPWKVNVISQAEPNMGIGFARAAAVLYANATGLDAFIMADDDTIPKTGEVEELAAFVRRGRAIFCAAWMQIHNAWYGRELGEQPGFVIPHFGDKLFAVNTQLALAAGNWHPGFSCRENNEMFRRSIRFGYLWWTHTSVHNKEFARTGSAGGIQAVGPSREEKLRRDHELAYIQWPDYVSAPLKKFSTRMSQMIGDFIGPEAVEAYQSKAAFRADDPDIPCRQGPAPLIKRERQVELTW